MTPAQVYGFINLMLPDHIAAWDVLDYWEKPRWASMVGRLDRDDCLFIVGAEHGFVAATYALFCPQVVLFEPTPEFWPNIRLTWEANGLPYPVACVPALVGHSALGNPEICRDGVWPIPAAGLEHGAGGYRYIHNHDGTPCVTVDEFVESTLVVPTAMSIDVEGAELDVLKGAERTLAEHHPLLWVSEHPDLAKRDYGVDPGDVHAFLARFGYNRHHIATDHEVHVLYEAARKA